MKACPSIKTLVNTSLLALLCLGQTVAQADDGGTGIGVLTIEGSVSDSTCVVSFKNNSASTSENNVATLTLDNIQAKNINVKEAWEELDPISIKYTLVSLKNSSGTPCNLDTKSKWDFEIFALNTQVNDDSLTLLKSAAGASDAVRSNVLVQLKAQFISNLSNPTFDAPQNIYPNTNETLGAQLGTVDTEITNSSGFAISAVYVKPDSSVTAGTFSSPITLSVKYP